MSRRPSSQIVTTVILSLLVSVPAFRAGATSSRLAFETEWLDLETGNVELDCDIEACSGGQDFKFAYNGNTPIHARLFQNQLDGRQIAFLDERPFAGVHLRDIASASFTTELIDVPFEVDDTILLRTDTGATFKIGHPMEDVEGVIFDHERLLLSTRLAFETEWLDLETANVELDCDIEACSGGEDFKFAYNGNTPIHARLFQNQLDGRQIAFLDERPFDTVGFADAASAVFTTDLVDVPFEGDDTILLVTDSGETYKIGNATEDPLGVDFDAALLPEPGTYATGATAILTLLGLRRRGRRR